ncbi:mannosyltransferase family protein [Streptomyces sp. NPDC007910]|uniref:mannosyltransferase family protein n=1 Tax=unclassified Streptomyces TaxID=2593676 RepID=UPI0036E9AAE8
MPISAPPSPRRAPVRGASAVRPVPSEVPSRATSPQLGPADREVLWLYLMTRAAVWTTAYCTRWLFPASGDARVPAPVLSSFEHWDWGHFLNIARDGYFPGGPGPGDNREAFFPGLPLVLRAVHVLVPHWTVAGLLVSLVAGAVAAVALARIAELHLPGSGAGRRAALFLLVSPCAVFLAAGYSEALFLAFALPAWLAARRQRWLLASVLAAGATTVRISGLFLAAALVVLFLTTRTTRTTLTTRTTRTTLPTRRGEGASRKRDAAWLALPGLPALLYFWYLYGRTGDPMAWKHAQERGWYRHFRAPWEAWSQTWHEAFDRTQATGYAAQFQADLLAMVLGLLLLAFLVVRRRWPEAVYIALTLWALGTSYWYMSVARSTLLWWPLWVGLAVWSVRRRWVAIAYLCLVAPLSTVLAITFMSGRWAG